MYPYARLVKVLALAPRRAPLEPDESGVVTFRVWPGDLDTNRHLNNGRYLTLMDLGRWDLMMRMGLLRHVMRRRWMPVVAAATMRYRRSLDPFQRYDLRTRVLGWDERSIYIEQTFEREETLHAHGMVRAALLAPGGRRIAPQELIDLLRPGIPSPPLPERTLLWKQAMDAAQPDSLNVVSE